MKQPSYSIIFESAADFLTVMSYINDHVTPSTGKASTASNAATMLAPVGQAVSVNPVAPAQHPQIGVDLDASGSPHIAGIHSDAKSKDENGFWKGRRGIGKPARESAEAAARAQLAGTPVPAVPAGVAPMPSLPGVAAAPVMPSLPGVPALSPVAAAPVVPSLPGMPAPVPVIAAPPVPVVSMQDVVDYAGSLSAAGWQPEHFQSVYASAGVTDPGELATNETLRANVLAALKKAAGQ